jgi:hypothetical protein
MTPSSVSAPSDQPPAAPVAPKPNPPTTGLRFTDVLRALNPLQYLPVVGTIYRAVTGDTVPEALQVGGSLLVSGLISGPIGLVTTAAITIAEKITGIDPDRIGRTLLADVGVGKPVQTAAPKAAAPVAAPPAAPVQTPSPATNGWTVADLSRQGVTFGADNTPSWHGLGGAEALNGVELGRIRTAAAAYARTAALAL